jgi:hypothetical protein
MIDPFDPTTDEDGLLAVSALLDGTATGDERARVAADPALEQLVADLRSIREPLRSVPVPAAVREQMIAAALAEFDGATAAAATTPTTTPVTGSTAATTARVLRFEHRRRWYAVGSGAAAAAVAVLFVGALVVGGRDSGDESVADEATTAKAVTGALDTSAAPFAATGGSGEERSDVATADAEVAAAAQESGLDDATGTAAPMAATEMAPTATMAAAEGTIAEIDAPADTVSITSPEQLAAYARTQRAVLPLPGLGLPCVDEGTEAVGEVTYQGIASIVVRDSTTGEIRAHDLQDGCAVLAVVAP